MPLNSAAFRPISTPNREGAQIVSGRKSALGCPALGADRDPRAPDLLSLPASPAACRGCAGGKSRQGASAQEGGGAGTSTSMALVGAVVGEGDAIAVFLDRTIRKLSACVRAKRMPAGC